MVLLLSHPSIDALSDKNRDSLVRYCEWFTAETGAELVVEIRDLLANLSCAVGRAGWVNGNPDGWRYEYSYEAFHTDLTLLLEELSSFVR